MVLDHSDTNAFAGVDGFDDKGVAKFFGESGHIGKVFGNESIGERKTFDTKLDKVTGFVNGVLHLEEIVVENFDIFRAAVTNEGDDLFDGN